MPGFKDRSEPLPVGGPEDAPIEDGSDAFAVGAGLYHLALKYWSEERPEDAMRVGAEAVRILRQDPRGRELVEALRSTLGEIATEIKRNGQPPLTS
jgi:hypothetical protein